MPCEANAAAQTVFLTELTTLVTDVAAGEALLCRRGPSHPRSTRARCLTGKARALLSVSGSERVNIHAALNAAHPDQARIYVVCDDARYYKNRELASWLADKPLYQVFLPPYSPNLNLIERLWKFVRQKIINTTFCRPEGAFKTTVLCFFDQLPEFGP